MEEASPDSDTSNGDASSVEETDEDTSIIIRNEIASHIDEALSDDDQGTPDSAQRPAELSSIRLSTWKPNPQNVSLEAQVTRIKLNATDEVTFIGQYDLEVKEGVVIVCGATLRANGSSFRIFAPSTHALPCIRCMSKQAIVEIRPSDNSILPLSKISPLLRRIWNQNRARGTPGRSQTALTRDSFCFVSIPGSVSVCCSCAVATPFER